MAVFSPLIWKKLESLCRLLMKRFPVKISQKFPPHFWHSLQPGPSTFKNAQFDLGLRKYYVLAISVSNFSPLNAFLLSILITFPVRLILRGVLGMWKRSIFMRINKCRFHRSRFHFAVQILVAIPPTNLEAVNRFHIPIWYSKGQANPGNIWRLISVSLISSSSPHIC